MAQRLKLLKSARPAKSHLPLCKAIGGNLPPSPTPIPAVKSVDVRMFKKHLPVPPTTNFFYGPGNSKGTLVIQPPTPLSYISCLSLLVSHVHTTSIFKRYVGNKRMADGQFKVELLPLINSGGRDFFWPDLSGLPPRGVKKIAAAGKFVSPYPPLISRSDCSRGSWGRGIYCRTVRNWDFVKNCCQMWQRQSRRIFRGGGGGATPKSFRVRRGGMDDWTVERTDAEKCPLHPSTVARTIDVGDQFRCITVHPALSSPPQFPAKTAASVIAPDSSRA